MSDTPNIGRAIDLLRQRADISKKELSLATGIDQGNLNRIINRGQWPAPDKLQALSDYFGVPVWQIFRIAEEGVDYLNDKEDARKATLKRLIDSLDDRQLDAAFRHALHQDQKPASAAPALPTPAKRRA